MDFPDARIVFFLKICLTVAFLWLSKELGLGVLIGSFS